MTPGVVDPPDLSQCLRAEKLAAVSIAAEVGIAVGDLVVAIDDAPATDRGPGPAVAGERWVVYSPHRREQLSITTSGVDLGVELWRTNEAMAARGTASPRELEVLWKRGEWALLERLSKVRLAEQRDDPALAFLGAALAETGRDDDGEALTAEFARDYSGHWPLCYTGVALYYGGLAELRRGHRPHGLELLATSFSHEPYARVAEAIRRESGEPVPAVQARWVGQRFPIDYRLARVDGGGPAVRLFEELRALEPNQVLFVCMMAEQRGNGPYDDFMRRYRGYAAQFRLFVRGLHVLTSSPARPRDRDRWFVGEEGVIADGLPFDLLFDAETQVADTLQPRGVPHVLVVASDGRVVREGLIEPVELWEALAAVAAGPDAARTAVRPATASRALDRDAMRWWIVVGVVLLVAGTGGLRACGACGN